jgi:hypothetical protein
MKNKPGKGNRFSRRHLFPLLGGSLLLPFLGFGGEDLEQEEDSNIEYETLLKPDGTTVKVKVGTINKSKVIKKNMSNTSFLNWLGKKE